MGGLAGSARRAHSDPWRASALGCGSHPGNALGGASGHDTQPVQDLDMGAMLVSPRGSSGGLGSSSSSNGASRRPSPLSAGPVAPPCGVAGGVPAGGPWAQRAKSGRRVAAVATTGMLLGPLERRGGSSDCSSGGGPLEADWLHVALSAYQSREIAQGDPSVHVRWGHGMPGTRWVVMGVVRGGGAGRWERGNSSTCAGCGQGSLLLRLHEQHINIHPTRLPLADLHALLLVCRHLKPVSCGQGTVVYRGAPLQHASFLLWCYRLPSGVAVICWQCLSRHTGSHSHALNSTGLRYLATDSAPPTNCPCLLPAPTCMPPPPPPPPGVWQGILVAIKFCLLRRETHQQLLQQHQQQPQEEQQQPQGQQEAGHDARTFHRELSRLVASLCAPNSSCLARTYAADMSEVVLALPPPPIDAPDPGSPCGSAAAAATAQAPRLPSRYGNGPMLALRPFDDDGVSGELGSLLRHGSATDITASACASALCSVTRTASDASASTSASTSTTLPCTAPSGRFPPTSSSSQNRLHFSSVVFGAERPQPASLLSPLSGPSVLSPPNSFCSNGARGSTDSSTGSRAAASPASTVDGTLQGLLFYLGARPGDYLVHSVMELASGGNLWHAMGGGAFAMHGVGLYTLLRSARSIARGLYQLHTFGHVHGGLTPSNVLLTWGGGVGSSADDSGASGRRRGFTAHVADFGVRRLVLGDARWQWQLGSNGELLRCTAPELLAAAMGAVASCAREAGLAGPSGTIARLGRGPPLEWHPSHDIYS